METIRIKFDELIEPMAPVHISTGPEPILLVPPTPAVQVLVVSTSITSSTTIDQDALSPSYSSSSSAVQPPISHQGVAAEPTIQDNLVA
ncbi:hypothetical protein Tco_1293986 [Tanacetum coccineum]